MKKNQPFFKKIIMMLLCACFILAHASITSFAEEKTYIIGTDTTFAPFEYQDVNGNYVGIDIDLIKAVAKHSGFSIELRPMGFSAAVQALEAGQIDGVIASMTITSQRQQTFDFSDSYYESGIGVAVSSNSSIQSLEDLSGKNVAVKIGTQSADYAESVKDKYHFTITTYEDSANMYQAVVSQNSAAAFEDYAVMAYSISNQNLPLTLLNINANSAPIGFAVLKGKNPELINMFNSSLQAFRSDGTYQNILNTYLGEASQQNQERTDFIGLIQTNFGTLMGGLWNTLWITFIAIVLALIIGILFGLMKTSHHAIPRLIATFYIDLMRGVPLIVLAFFIYFGIPQATGFRMEAALAGIMTLSLNAAAYIAEIVRGGIAAVDKGQTEASVSLGLTYATTMRTVILPQAIRIMVPSFINQFVITLKDTSILSVIGLVELTQTGKLIIARNLQSSQMWLIIGILYLIVITILTKLSAHLEKQIKQ
ncbi:MULTISPECIES: ABC transporter substrate-binding protein/permease [unclassified Granulicatella]|uniref:ABC transporter substrate-binding protein/permease n=1 Tax=unclassified Granulicatella TaxID=2630493 RepID=UPI0010747043|nr:MULTISPECIES: ABC transporter substrate-binding protein/permease [unclassified Granulicatella]MBF0780630.1 ABC transporter substrate-binding protein/permease [Granulicatella sp. 19428wC4_WM01]TFU94588.1 transporter substrate-binding domain-containing protein [Granulicatella sp. WM01]